MKRTAAAVLLAMSVALGAGQTGAQTATEELQGPTNVYATLQRLSEALPAPGGSLRANIVSSSRYGLRVSGKEVIVTTAFLREASSNALVAGVVCQLLRDPVYFSITMDRAGFDGPSGLAELNERLLYDLALESQYRAAVNAAYAEMMQTTFQDSFWIFAQPGNDLMYGRIMDAATLRYYEVLAAYEVYRAERPDLPPITAGFIRTVTEATTALRSGAAGVPSYWPQIQEALKTYPPRRGE